MGAFALVPIKRGSLVWDWTLARRYTARELPEPYVKDEYLQVAEDLYIGPSPGPPDAADFANHSCDPNCRMNIALPAIEIVASRDIEAGEEITYDYSTTQTDQWEMVCNCGSKVCRGIIRNSMKDSGKG